MHQNAKYLLFDKINVNGPNASEVFKFLRSNSELLNSEDQTVGHIHWNFGKFLVDQSGNVLHYFSPREEPENVADAVKHFINFK